MATAVTVKADFTDELRRLAGGFVARRAKRALRADGSAARATGVNRVNEITPPAGTATASIEQSR